MSLSDACHTDVDTQDIERRDFFLGRTGMEKHEGRSSDGDIQGGMLGLRLELETILA